MKISCLGATVMDYSKKEVIIAEGEAARYTGVAAIPADRQELADYLQGERSGLYAENGKLRKEGILECRKNVFSLLRCDVEL